MGIIHRPKSNVVEIYAISPWLFLLLNLVNESMFGVSSVRRVWCLTVGTHTANTLLIPMILTLSAYRKTSRGLRSVPGPDLSVVAASTSDHSAVHPVRHHLERAYDRGILEVTRISHMHSGPPAGGALDLQIGRHNTHPVASCRNVTDLDLPNAAPTLDKGPPCRPPLVRSIQPYNRFVGAVLLHPVVTIKVTENG